MNHCLLYTSDAADDLTRVDLGGRRIIKNHENRLEIITSHNKYGISKSGGTTYYLLPTK